MSNDCASRAWQVAAGVAGRDREGRRLRGPPRGARSGRGVVLTTHYLEEADVLADRIVVIDRGVVIAQGSPDEIKARVPGRRVRARTSLSPDAASRLPGVVSASRESPWLELLAGSAEPVLRALLDLDPAVAGVTVTEASLEEAFLALTTDTEASR